MKLKTFFATIILPTLLLVSIIGKTSATPADCLDQSNCPNPSTRPSPSPSTRPSLPPSPRPSPRPSPSTEPTPSPTPTSDFRGVDLSTSLSCNSSGFEAKMLVTENGSGIAGVNVIFKYKSETKNQLTDSNGEAKVGFEYRGEDEVYGEASGYGSENTKVSAPLNCEAGIGGGGEVLGATTMAETGTLVEDVISIMFAFGSTLVALGASGYAKVKKIIN